ncbi:MAG TPA: RagB/SusD family nutrient uptake outer membrane protein [Saprospiraceae bacterium]|nr:RagB/SusD family nutrient uptake outer membrane protein [Saprospiraceae bacterium]
MIKNIILLFAILCCVWSCDVLDVEPQNSIPASEAFKNKNDLERGILGAYNSFQSLSYYGRTYGIFADLAADNLAHPPNATAVAYAEVDNNAILPENTSVDGIWTAIYDGLNVVNNVITKVAGIPDMTVAEKNEAFGELYFIRALHHFNLTNYFGAIPVKTTPTVGLTNVNVPRDPVDAVYNQIITDLLFASEYLPASSDRIRASKGAANALLARVYLYKKDYANAVTYATKVIDDNNYSFLPEYSDVFSSEETAESIFEIDFTALDRNRIAEYNFPLAENGRGEVTPSADMIDSYEFGDKRFDATYAYSGTTPYVVKYDDLSTGSENVIVLRLAEMYLIRAEAGAKLQTDITLIWGDVNIIRNRAGLGTNNTVSYDDVLNAVEKERRHELAFEGHRWFDLVRTGRAVDVLGTVTNINQTLFPIPLSELLTNTNPGMYQNPGY